MARFVIVSSPLVKAFLPEWHERLMEDPDRLLKDEDFAFDVPRGTSAFKVRFNHPVEVHGRDDKEVLNLFNWLTGGYDGREFPETDSWGLVPYEPKIDLARQLDEMARLEVWADAAPEEPENKQAKKAATDLKKLRNEAKTAMLAAREEAKEKSEARVLRAMKLNHNNLIRQWALNEEQKMGKYPPSVSEMMGAHALGAQIEAANAKRAAVVERMNKLMQNQIV